MRPLSALLLVAAVAGCTPAPIPVPSFPVFFNENSSQLDATALGSIDQAAAAAKGHPTDKVVVSGYAAPTGNAQQSIDLSVQRAQAVINRLVADGVATTRISSTARAAIGPAGPTPQQDRRVDITVGGS